MAYRNSEWEASLHENTLFPAYVNYVSGYHMQGGVDQEAVSGSNVQEAGAQFDLTHDRPTEVGEQAPPYHTSDMPARLGAHKAFSHNTYAPDGTILAVFQETGPPSYDLRWSPQHRHITKLIKPETVHSRGYSLNAPPISKTSGFSQGSQPMPSVESSEDQSSHGTSSHQDKDEKFSSSTRKTRTPSDPFCISSIFDTNSGSEEGQVLPPKVPVLASPFLATAYLQPRMLKHKPNKVQKRTHGEVTPVKSSTTRVPILKPGDLLANPSFAEIPGVSPERFDSQIRSLWSTAQKHSDKGVRDQALAQLRHVSNNVSEKVLAWCRTLVTNSSRATDMSEPLEPPEPQVLGQRRELSQSEESYQSQELSQFQGSLQTQELFSTQSFHQSQKPFQSQVQGLYQSQNQTEAQYGFQMLPQSQEFPQHQGLSQQHGLRFSQGLSLLEDLPTKENEGQVEFIDPRLLQLNAPIQAEPSHYPQLHAPSYAEPVHHVYIDPHQRYHALRSQEPVLGQKQSQESREPSLSASALEEKVRKYLNSILPRVCTALHLAKTPDDLANLKLMEAKRQAGPWLLKLKSSLPPIGHKLLEDIANQVAEGREVTL